VPTRLADGLETASSLSGKSFNFSRNTPLLIGSPASVRRRPDLGCFYPYVTLLENLVKILSKINVDRVHCSGLYRRENKGNHRVRQEGDVFLLEVAGCIFFPQTAGRR
jgi:hypothetical protein